MGVRLRASGITIRVQDVAWNSMGAGLGLEVEF